MTHKERAQFVKWLSFRFILLILLLQAPAMSDAEREECAVCGMWIEQYMNTRHVITMADDSEKSFCSIACAAKFIQANEGMT